MNEDEGLRGPVLDAPRLVQRGKRVSGARDGFSPSERSAVYRVIFERRDVRRGFDTGAGAPLGLRRAG